MRVSLLYALLLGGAAIICFLSWLPNPRISTYGFFSQEIGHWVDADAHVNNRTAIPFLAMGLFSGVWLVFTKQPLQQWIGVCLGFMGIVLVAEMGQLHLPNRHFDWGDIAWGTAGGLGGMVVGAVFASLLALFRQLPPRLKSS